MRDYNFNEKLTWQEFQELACEIVQRKEKVQLQTFKMGPDKGKDGFWFVKDKYWVVQAKKYGDFKSLYSKLQKEEVKKVKQLNPDRYTLVLSIELTENQEQKIFSLFEGYIKQSEDLITKRELNSFLSQKEYRDIEISYKNLWLTDAKLMFEMIKEFLGGEQNKRNIIEYKKVIDTVKTFSITQKYEQALEQMNKNHTIIISGEPGMGKTTIARMLAFKFLEIDGMEGYIWAEEIEQIESKWDITDKKQVFILDDYWGSVFYDGSKKKRSRKLEDLIYQVRENKNKRLIITSREYIVQQEICESPELEDIIKNLKIECVLKDYTDAEKAKILFSHLKASELEYEYALNIFYTCDEIIKNIGYSPRIIEKFLKLNNSMEYTPYEYTNALLEYLEYPENFWRDIFKELSEEARIITMIIAISYTPIGINDIRKNYGKYIQYYAKDKKVKAFEACIAELEKTFVFTYWDEEMEDIRIEFDNPSIIDFLYLYINENQEFYVQKLCKISVFYNQLLTLIDCFEYYDEDLSRGIEKRCVMEFYDLPMKLRDYGEKELGEYVEDKSSWSGRAFHLLRVSRGGKYDKIKEFIYCFINTFFENQEKHLSSDVGDELIDYIGLVRLAEKEGLHFDGKVIMEKYWSHCYFATSYVYFEDFEMIYPEIYKNISSKYFEFMKNNIKEIILESLEYFETYEYYEEMDMLVDNIPDILKKYNLRYTDNYKEHIMDITGRYYEESQHNYSYSYDKHELTKEEEDYEKVKEEGYNWLFGSASEILEDEEIIVLIENQNMPLKITNQLLKIVKEQEPWYIYEILCEKQNINLLEQIIRENEIDEFPEEINRFMWLYLYSMAEGKEDYIKRIVLFCRNCVEELLYKENAVVIEKRLKESVIFNEYIEKNQDLEAVLFTYIFKKKGKWVEVINEEFVLYCYCFLLLLDEDFDWDILQEHEPPKLLRKDSEGSKHFYYSEIDIGTVINWQWKCIILKLFQQMDKERFYVQYVIPILQDFLNNMHNKENKILALLNELKPEIVINDKGEVVGEQAVIIEAIEMLEILGITELHGCLEEKFTKEEISCLLNRKHICKQNGKETRVSVYKEKGTDFLKECGIYRVFNEFYDEVNQFVETYSNNIF